MIKKETILSVFDEKITLLQYLKEINKLLVDDSIIDFSVVYEDETHIKLRLTLNNGDTIDTNAISVLQGPTGPQGPQGTGLIYLFYLHTINDVTPVVNNTITLYKGTFNRTPIQSERFYAIVTNNGASYLCILSIDSVTEGSNQITARFKSVVETTGAQGPQGPAGAGTQLYKHELTPSGLHSARVLIYETRQSPRDMLPLVTTSTVLQMYIYASLWVRPYANATDYENDTITYMYHDPITGEPASVTFTLHNATDVVTAL